MREAQACRAVSYAVCTDRDHASNRLGEIGERSVTSCSKPSAVRAGKAGALLPERHRRIASTLVDDAREFSSTVLDRRDRYRRDTAELEGDRRGLNRRRADHE